MMLNLRNWFFLLMDFFSPSISFMGYLPNGKRYFGSPFARLSIGDESYFQQQPNSTLSNNVSGMYKDPFGTASSGGQSGTLQPYVNRMTQNASNALYGGLLGYSPQSMVAGDAGGTPQNSTVPQFNIPSALSQFGNGLNFTGFGNRSWMGGGNGN